nr:UPF0462 protein C4orf33-like [Parasteatoda tepidariorum]
MEFSILTTWDDKPIDHEATIIKLHSEDDVVIMEIKAPFYDDPPPNPRGTDKSFNKLWDYEVVEAFFLGKAEKYLELEFSPKTPPTCFFVNSFSTTVQAGSLQLLQLC